MLKFKMAKVNFFYFILILFFSTNGLANEFYKCPEKVTEVYKGQSQYINEGSIIGTNYINIRNSYITIKFKELGSSIRATKIIFNKKLNRNSLGYEIFEKYSENGLTRENTYNFIKIDNSYAFTRKEYYWSPNSQSQKKNYEYESSGRCLKISENEYKKERVIKVAKKEVKKIIKKKKESQNNSKIIKGERSIAMNWQGYDDLILGKIKFSEKDLMGKLEFSLPNNDGRCIGTYVLSKTKGTWSIYCESQDVNASGFLKWNKNDGSVNGNGKDNKGKKIKFKVGPAD
jgi:hypothetical protein|tara:strand:- start:41 stop:901 length:861 start_codon:yes stop_codon:yes gene_type:complete